MYQRTYRFENVFAYIDIHIQKIQNVMKTFINWKFFIKIELGNWFHSLKDHSG